jgi:hypothetical protein
MTLLDLPKQWREKAERSPLDNIYDDGHNERRVLCADELEAALPKPGEAEAVKLAVFFLCGESPTYSPEIGWSISNAKLDSMEGRPTKALMRLLDVLDELLPDGDK